MSTAERIRARTTRANQENSSVKVQRPHTSQSLISPADHVLFLQSTIGNQAVQRLFKAGILQPKLTIGQPGDVYEQEADRIAEQVMKIPEPPVQRQPQEEEEDEEEEELQMKASLGQTPQVPADLESRINATKGRGRPLSASSRAFFEPRFGYDFSRVRIHTAAGSDTLNRDLNAWAFTARNNVFFRRGTYRPGSLSARKLLAHELTHVVQQERRSLPRKNRGNMATQRSIPGPFLQLKPDSNTDIKTMDWKKAVEATAKLAQKNKGKAKAHYKQLIVRAAKQVTAPSPLVDRKPTVKDIGWNWAISSRWGAIADAKLVDNYPNNYWRWLTFGPAIVEKDRAWTQSAILHELDHAAHAKAIYDEWKKAAKKGKWDAYWLAHLARWREKPIKVGAEAGILKTLAGLPGKVRPSAIEFRAYVNQFIHFFHKYSIENQQFITQALILFYPLVKQKVGGKITDPYLDVSKATRGLLDYFRSPPVKGKDQQRIVRIRIASEFRYAVLFRPSADREKIRMVFKAIFEYKFSEKEREDARKSYKPQQ